MKEIDFAFLGTDEFSVKVLETLKTKGFVPSLVITMPDKPTGRKMILTPPPIKVWAQKNNLNFIQPESLKNISDFDRQELIVNRYQFFLVASYGQIIPEEILNLPTYGTLNIHPSLLPQYRGPAPLETAILNGEPETGVTIIKLDAEMDHGPILAQKKFTLADQFNFEQLRDYSAKLGAEMLTEIIPDYLAGKITPQEQEHLQATFTKKIKKNDGQLNSSDSDLVNFRKILAFTPWPGAYVLREDHTRLIIKSAHLDAQNHLIYDRVLPAGKKEMSWDEFQRGLK